MMGFADLSRRGTDLLALQPGDIGLEAAAEAVVVAERVASRRLLALIGERIALARIA